MPGHLLDDPVRCNLLPLLLEVVVDLPIGDGHHDDQDPEQHDADEELVEGPHRHGRGLQVAGGSEKTVLA